ncbi:MAG TPA: hypothetical protein VFD92_05140 [Candidatus Binatia bacterium]|nr:hypothetical protein [Candidatus Binatia bacterium]
MLDTLAYARRLKQAGVPEQQAEAHAEALATALDDQLATKRDVDELGGELVALEGKLGQRIERVDRRIDEVESRLLLRMSEMENRLTLRLGALLAFGLGALATLQITR